MRVSDRLRVAIVCTALVGLATVGCNNGSDTRADAGTVTPDGSIDGGAPPGDGGGGGACTATVPTPGCNEELGIECDGDWRGTNPRTGQEFCNPGCDADQCCTPQGGRFVCVDRDADCMCPAPDLFVDRDRILDQYAVEYRSFAAGSCAIAEGCVGGPGPRRLLRFDTWTPNIGTADMFLGQPNMSSPYYEYSACHRHYHFNTYAQYELLDADGNVAATGHKQAFCLLDFYRYPGTDGRGAVYNCGYQGIEMGWQDVYSRDLDCQWVDVTDVPPGEYTLHIRINTEHILNETDYTNNEITVPVTITTDPGPPPVDIDADCGAGADDGLARNCGFDRAYDGTCTAGETVTVGCSAACGAGTCTGDTIMRVCETAVGVSCDAGNELASNDDSGCGTAACGDPGGDCCSRVSFTCPGTGTYTVWTAPYRDGDAAMCNVSTM